MHKKWRKQNKKRKEKAEATKHSLDTPPTTPTDSRFFPTARAVVRIFKVRIVCS